MATRMRTPTPQAAWASEARDTRTRGSPRSARTSDSPKKAVSVRGRVRSANGGCNNETDRRSEDDRDVDHSLPQRERQKIAHVGPLELRRVSLRAMPSSPPPVQAPVTRLILSEHAEH